MTDNSEWLASLKAGDLVAIARKFKAGWDVFEVTRTTATQIVVGEGPKYSRASGYIIGRGNWNTSRIQPVTPEILEMARRERNLSLLGDIASGRVRIDNRVLGKMVDVFRASEKPDAREKEDRND